MKGPIVVFAELPALCTMVEAAGALRCSRDTVKRLIARGEIRVAKLAHTGSSRVLVPRVELERLANAALV